MLLADNSLERHNAHTRGSNVQLRDPATGIAGEPNHLIRTDTEGEVILVLRNQHPPHSRPLNEEWLPGIYYDRERRAGFIAMPCTGKRSKFGWRRCPSLLGDESKTRFSSIYFS